MRSPIFQKSRISSLERKVAVMDLALRGCQKNLDSIMSTRGLGVKGKAVSELAEKSDFDVKAFIEKQNELIESFNHHIKYHREYNQTVCGLIVVMIVIIVLLVTDIYLLRSRLEKCEPSAHTEQTK